MPKWVEFLAFQVVWLACVLGAAHGSGWIGVVAAAAFAAAIARASAAPWRALAAACVAGALGSGADAAARAFGWIEYRGAPLAGVWAPAWIVALWVSFAATLSSSLAWLRGRAWLSVPFAAVGAPLSYTAAARLDAVELGLPRTTAYAGVGASWVVALHAAQLVESRLRAGGSKS